jgi:CheY-like chemotaxis protein
MQPARFKLCYPRYPRAYTKQGLIYQLFSMTDPTGFASLFVLLVEDNPADVFLVQEAIQREALQVRLEVVENGEDAIQIIQKMESEPSANCPDLILLDLNVPRQPGDQVLKRIRSSFRMGRIPVIVMSSSESLADRERLMKLGATDFFRKSASLGDFMKLGPLLRTFCGGTQGS